MITLHDLDEAIAECNGDRNPNANTCIKLAAYLILKREMFGLPQTEKERDQYSFSSGPDPVPEMSESDFLRAVSGKNSVEVWKIMDELMESMQVLQPRIYDSVMRKVNNA